MMTTMMMMLVVSLLIIYRCVCAFSLSREKKEDRRGADKKVNES